jgi:CheY-like chemotaxis protein
MKYVIPWRIPQQLDEACAAVLQGRRVLLAEDNLINQTVAKKMLTVLGLACEVACNGAEAVSLARAGAADGRPFDVVLMDMAMPVMNGTEACRVRRSLLCFLVTFPELD